MIPSPMTSVTSVSDEDTKKNENLDIPQDTSVVDALHRQQTSTSIRAVGIDKEYNRNPKLFWLMVPIALSAIPWNVPNYSIYHNNAGPFRALFLVISCLSLIVYIGLFIYFSMDRTRCRIFAPHMKRKKQLYDVTGHSKYFFIVWLFAMIWTAIIDIIHESAYHSSFARAYQCPNFGNDGVIRLSEKDYDLDRNFYDGCLLEFAALTPNYQFFIGLAFIFSYLLTVKDECIEESEGIRKGILDKYPVTKQMNDTIKLKLEEWRASKRFGNRKMELVTIFIVFLVYHIGSFFVRLSVFSGIYPAGVIVHAMVYNIMDSVVMTFAIALVHTTLRHYRFPQVIMAALSDKIKITGIEDVVGWWELRNYYNDCVIALYTTKLSLFIFGTLASSTVIFAVLISLWDTTPISFRLLFISWALYILFATLISVSRAVSYHNALLGHSDIINKFQFQLQANKYLPYYQDDKERDLIENVIARISYDVTNSPPISVLEVKMNDNFMLFLRATTISLIVGIVLSIQRHLL